MLLVFAMLSSYKLIYILVSLKTKYYERRKVARFEVELPNKFGIIISARNEEMVIGNLIKSIKMQKYPSKLIDIFVVADNCTDNTAKVAKESGAIVWERFDNIRVGKSYALDFMLKIIETEYADSGYDGYFVFDADNILDKNYIFEMNKTFNKGFNVITSYRNSKNYNDNWITAGYSLWFLHESEYINLPRMKMGTSCAISGTGFLINAEILRSNKGWVHHLLTEDIEFSVDHIINGGKIGYCNTAVIYDEQPVKFYQSWHQRLRWAKGFYQVFAKYGGNLIKGIFRKNSNRLSCFDMTMTIAPAMFVSCISITINSFICLISLLDTSGGKEIFMSVGLAFIKSLLWYYLALFTIGLITTISEWKKIHCTGIEKIMYTFTFPIFMFTYLPISVVAIFANVKWKPISHTIVKSAEDFQ